ncbi:MAG: 6-carboxytetrahydropterin synthase [Chloroflexi bacterium]|nr:6-carboxytetrahydropterin synthase [Chloroflexota bacterium]
MYRVCVRRDFIAQHYLTGGDWGAENQLHAHHYVLEAWLEGERLDEHGYLTDITEIEAALDELAARYRDRALNELPEFAGLNPSLEHFARILCQALAGRIRSEPLASIAVRLWEHDSAWAEYRAAMS